tara:strand:+ start:1120 stop:1257 length:138 start_codon:yes stop_codon:yes gene_type:complete
MEVLTYMLAYTCGFLAVTITGLVIYAKWDLDDFMFDFDTEEDDIT